MTDLKTNWKTYEYSIVRPVWNMYHSRYESFGLEYGDFTGIAYEILAKEMPKYQNAKSAITTYGITVLKTRMIDYIRNNYETDKTAANSHTRSLNVLVSEDSDEEILDTIATPDIYKPENDIFKIKRFMKTLSTRQKEILLLSSIGLDCGEIESVLNISHREYEENIKKLRNPRRVSKLKYNRGEVV